jgi:predicted TIM-barrel fold metal-dependent hydrolase
LTTQPATDVTAEQFLQLVEMADTERVWLFATDYPHYDADEVDTVLSRALPDDLRRRIRYENALETYPKLQHLGS